MAASSTEHQQRHQQQHQQPSTLITCPHQNQLTPSKMSQPQNSRTYNHSYLTHKQTASQWLTPAQARQAVGVILWALLGVWVAMCFFSALHSSENEFGVANPYDEGGGGGGEGEGKSRQKRFLHVTSQRQLTVPPGTVFALAFVMNFPFLGNLPLGYSSALTVTIPITVAFDKLENATSDENTFGIDINGFPFNKIREKYNKIKDKMPFIDIGDPPFLTIQRKKRDQWQTLPGVNYHGGDREMFYQVIEDLLVNIGVPGHHCLLRSVCEIHHEPLQNYGFFGEVLTMMLTPTLAEYANERLLPFVQAEETGRSGVGCQKYHEQCQHSFFVKKEWHDDVIEDLSDNYIYEDSSNSTRNPHHRSKRFIFFGPHQRLLFPPSSLLSVVPTLNLPFLRNLPPAYKSGLSISIPFKVIFDKLGITSVLNTFGYLPFLKRKKRDIQPPELSEGHYAGGDRAIMYKVLSESLAKVGLGDSACLRRAVCESKLGKLNNFGFFGEFINAFLTPSFSPFAEERMGDYTLAEKFGHICGDCSELMSACPHSLFNGRRPRQDMSLEARKKCITNLKEKYSEEAMMLNTIKVEDQTNQKLKNKNQKSKNTNRHHNYTKINTNMRWNEVTNEFNQKTNRKQQHRNKRA